MRYCFNYVTLFWAKLKQICLFQNDYVSDNAGSACIWYMQLEFREAPYFHISEETNACVILRHARAIEDKVKPVLCDVRY